MPPAQRSKRGSLIVEGAAGMVVLITMLVMITYVILEASHAYLIWTSLQQGAREAAELIMSDPNVTSGSASNVNQAIQSDLGQIRIPNIINDSQQFTAPVVNYIPNQFLGQQGQTQNPTVVASVMVRVTYTSGQFGLPIFPDADVLNLGSLFKLQGTSTCNTPN